jgi:hypothetical protein
MMSEANLKELEDPGLAFIAAAPGSLMFLTRSTRCRKPRSRCGSFACLSVRPRSDDFVESTSFLPSPGVVRAMFAPPVGLEPTTDRLEKTMINNETA